MLSNSFCSNFIQVVDEKVKDDYPEHIKHYAVLACAMLTKNPKDLSTQFLDNLKCEVNSKNLPKLLEILYLLCISNTYENISTGIRTN